MRVRLIAMLLLVGTAVPALAQNERVERRVEKLETDMRAVQRKLFPAGPELQPEIGPQVGAAPLAGSPASSAVADLNARVDALEGQLARLTGQVEEGSFKLRQLEEGLNQLRAERVAAAPPPEPTPVRIEPATPAPSGGPPADDVVTTGDPAEDAYVAGFRLWEQKRFAEAHQTLEAMAAKYPKHPKASWARNLAGRAYLDEGKPASAAKVLLANYQTDPKGERAADSLYFLGQSLVQLKRTAEACQVYDELQEVYGANLRDYLRDRLPKARADAKCK
jgi:TolA-binding protein